MTVTICVTMICNNDYNKYKLTLNFSGLVTSAVAVVIQWNQRRKGDIQISGGEKLVPSFLQQVENFRVCETKQDRHKESLERSGQSREKIIDVDKV